MNYVVLDTSTDSAAIGVKAGASVTIAAPSEVPRRHGRDLIPRLQDALNQLGLSPSNLDVVAVGLGPGSYTGLRIGLAAAKTLAYVSGAAIIGLDSLEAVALNSPPDALRISVISDAQRGDVYSADFVREFPGAIPVATMTTRIEPLADWAARVEPGTFVIGPGLDSPRIRPALPGGIVIAEPSLNRPDAARLLELAVRTIERGQRDDLWAIEPHYLRRSAAEEQWEARLQTRPGSRDNTP
jgi:tRNA threonylcarbamoyladenosine biosynthesis protein TsaB